MPDLFLTESSQYSKEYNRRKTVVIFGRLCYIASGRAAAAEARWKLGDLPEFGSPGKAQQILQEGQQFMQ